MSSFLTEDGNPRAFVIVSSARSGSNLLVRYLRQVEQAACFGEILRESFVGTDGWQRLAARLDLPADAGALHARDLTRFWELLLSRALRRRRWAGAKVFYYHRRGDPIWHRFEARDHRIIHLVRDATFEQYVSRLLAAETGEWKGEGVGPLADPDVRVTFDQDDYLRYRTALRADIQAFRLAHAGSERTVEIEYRQLSDHHLISGLLERLFGQRIGVEEALQRQHRRPKIEYLTNPEAAEPFVADSISGGFREA